MKELGEEFAEIVIIGQGLVAKAKDISNWTEEDDKQLKIIKELIAMLTKVAPLASKEVEEEITSPEEDELILQRFFERKRKELSGE